MMRMLANMRTMAVMMLVGFLPATSLASPPCAGGYAPSFVLTGAVENSRSYRLGDLQGLTPSKATVSYFSGRDGLVTKTFIGVPLLDLLDAAVVVNNPAQKNDALRKFLVVTASDCYQVTVALAELLPTFGGQQIMVAFADGDGQPLDSGEGMARLVVPGDKAGGRFVSNITRIAVRSPGPALQPAP